MIFMFVNFVFFIVRIIFSKVCIFLVVGVMGVMFCRGVDYGDRWSSVDWCKEGKEVNINLVELEDNLGKCCLILWCDYVDFNVVVDFYVRVIEFFV